MKKFSKVFIFAILFITLSLNTFAYLYNGNDLYEIQIPEEYMETVEGQFIGKDDSNFIITVSEKEDKKYCIENISEKKLLEDAKKEAEMGKDAFAALGNEGNIEVVSCQKLKHENGKTACVTVHKTSMEKDGKTASHLQKTYRFSCEENDYIFVFTPHTDEDINSMDEAFNSIKINEPDAKSYADKITETIPLVIIISLILLGIFKFIRGRKR